VLERFPVFKAALCILMLYFLSLNLYQGIQAEKLNLFQTTMTILGKKLEWILILIDQKLFGIK